MGKENGRGTDFTETSPRASAFRRIIRVFFRRKVVLFGFVVIVVYIFAAIFAPYIAPHEPNKTDLSAALLQPSKEHFLGTDAMGRDLLSRIIYGGRISLLIGIGAVFGAALVGQAMGIVAGYFGGAVNVVIMRFADALMAFPTILTALVIAAVLGLGTPNVIIALGVAMVPAHTRLMCAQTLSIRETSYVMALRVVGASSLRIMLRHIFPNAIPPIIVLLTLEMGRVILAEAGLSFLGVGVPPPTSTWGGMISDGRDYLLTNPLISLAPGFAVMLFVFASNMVGDGLRDALDPRLRDTL